MYKNILVNIPTEHSPRPVIDGAISLAARCQARLDAVAAGHEIVNMPFLAEGGAAIAAISEVEHDKAMERARAALAVFEADAKRAGIAYSCRAIAELQADAAAIVGTTSRLYDLTIVAQPEFERDSFDNTLAQTILFQSGGPVLFIPYTFRGALQRKRIGICWDGSRLAARALRDAMPLLEQAEAITILTINRQAASRPMRQPRSWCAICPGSACRPRSLISRRTAPAFRRACFRWQLTRAWTFL